MSSCEQVDGTNQVDRVAGNRTGIDTGNYTTTATYAVIDDGATKARLAITLESFEVNAPLGATLVGAVVENTGDSALDAKLQGRYHDPDSGVTSGWVDVSEAASVAVGASVAMVPDGGPLAEMDEYQIVARSGGGSSSTTTVKGYLIGKGV